MSHVFRKLPYFQYFIYFTFAIMTKLKINFHHEHFAWNATWPFKIFTVNTYFLPSIRVLFFNFFFFLLLLIVTPFLLIRWLNFAMFCKRLGISWDSVDSGLALSLSFILKIENKNISYTIESALQKHKTFHLKGLTVGGGSRGGARWGWPLLRT